ncbi:MAG TPA: endospore germination permease [Clostridia bacterium]|nr:endospore germination permease [Clostridia bacterium]
MPNSIKFGKWEAVALLINSICTKLFLYYVRMTAEDAGSAGWILTIFISLVTLFLFTVLIRLYKPFEGKDILEVAEISGGKVLKILTGLIIAVILFYQTVITIREFSEDMKVISLPTSPLSYVILFFIAGMIVGSFLGLESIVRYHAILVPVIAVAYILILVGVIKIMDTSNLFPILGTGPSDIFGKGFLRISVFGELIILILIIPYIGSYKSAKRIGYAAIGFSSAFLTLGSLAYILSFPYPSDLEPFLPMYQMARLITYGRFFQRIESIFVFIWATAALMYLTVNFYFMVYVLSRMFDMKYLRPLILPCALIVFSTAFIPQNLITVLNIETNIFNKIIWVITFGYAGAVLIFANLRERAKRRGKKDETEA